MSPEFNVNNELSLDVISAGTIFCATHLIPCYGDGFVAGRLDINPSQTLDNFNAFYINKYVDHHASETIF